jgi:hypothetical protein
METCVYISVAAWLCFWIFFAFVCSVLLETPPTHYPFKDLYQLSIMHTVLRPVLDWTRQRGPNSCILKKKKNQTVLGPNITTDTLPIFVPLVSLCDRITPCSPWLHGCLNVDWLVSDVTTEVSTLFCSTKQNRNNTTYRIGQSFMTATCFDTTVPSSGISYTKF